jgi:hypothetical protein
MLYADEIAIILQDLGLPADHPVASYFKDKPYLKRGRNGSETWGWHSGNNRQAGTVKAATERSYRAVLETIAHELRHEWQKFTGVLAWDGNRGKYGGWHWSGTEHAPAKSYSSKYKYLNRPHEIDARAYAADAMERLFKDTTETKEPRTVKAAVVALFLEL